MQRALLERKTGVEPASNRFAVRTLTVRDHSHMAGVMRFEHTQRGFGDRCSTNWATPLHGASDGNWTRTPSLTPDFKSGASADSATEAYDGKLSYCRTLVLSAGLEPAKYTSWMCRVCQFHHKSIYGSFYAAVGIQGGIWTHRKTGSLDQRVCHSATWTYGGLYRAWTCDTRINSPLLYRLS